MPGPLELDRALGARTALAALRPRQWVHFVLLPAACFEPAAPLATSVPALLRGVLIAACALGYGYLLNALADRDTDRDHAKNPLVGRMPNASHRVLLVLLPAIAIVVGALSPTPVLLSVLVSIASGTAYSVGPRLKAKPGICTLLNATCFAPLLFVGLAGPRIGAAEWLLALCFSALLLQNQLLHEAADAHEDRAGRTLTSFLVLGTRRTGQLAAIVGLVVVLASIALAYDRGVSAWIALSALPFVLVFPTLLARHGSDSERMAKLRRVHRACSAAIGALLFVVRTCA